jgi:hypothetical protein
MKTGRRVNEADGPASFDLDLSEQSRHGDGGKASVIATPQVVVTFHNNQLGRQRAALLHHVSGHELS